MKVKPLKISAVTFIKRSYKGNYGGLLRRLAEYIQTYYFFTYIDTLSRISTFTSRFSRVHFWEPVILSWAGVQKNPIFFCNIFKERRNDYRNWNVILEFLIATIGGREKLCFIMCFTWLKGNTTNEL